MLLNTSLAGPDPRVGWWMLGPGCELKFGAQVSFWDQPTKSHQTQVFVGVILGHTLSTVPGGWGGENGLVHPVLQPRCGKRLPTKPKSKAPTEVLSSKRPTLMPQMARTQIHLARFWTELDLT